MITYGDSETIPIVPMSSCLKCWSSNDSACIVMCDAMHCSDANLLDHLVRARSASERFAGYMVRDKKALRIGLSPVGEGNDESVGR